MQLPVVEGPNNATGKACLGASGSPPFATSKATSGRGLARKCALLAGGAPLPHSRTSHRTALLVALALTAGQLGCRSMIAASSPPSTDRVDACPPRCMRAEAPSAVERGRDGASGLPVVAAQPSPSATEAVGARLVPASTTVDTALVVMADGASSPRSLAERFGELLTVRDFGATPNDGVDDALAFKRALAVRDINSADGLNGIRIRTPAGRYAICSELVVDTVQSEGLASITIEGEGKQNTILDFSCSSAGNGLSILTPTFVSLRDLQVIGAPLNNIFVADGSQFEIRNVRSQGARDGAGFYVQGAFAGSIQNAFSKANNGDGFRFSGSRRNVVTSLTIIGSYADGNAASGFHFNDVTYSSCISCASDNNAFHGYMITGTSGLSFIGSGAEANGRAGWYFLSDPVAYASNLVFRDVLATTLQNCFATGNNRSGGWANLAYVQSRGGRAEVDVSQCADLSSTQAGPSVLVDGDGARVITARHVSAGGTRIANGGIIGTIPTALRTTASVSATIAPSSCRSAARVKLPGARPGAECAVGIPAGADGSLLATCRVRENGVVDLVLCNHSFVTKNVPGAEYGLRVFDP